MALMDYKYLKDKILSLTGVDLNAYKEAQMKRRIDQLITKKGLSDYPAYIENAVIPFYLGKVTNSADFSTSSHHLLEAIFFLDVHLFFLMTQI